MAGRERKKPFPLHAVSKRASCGLFPKTFLEGGSNDSVPPQVPRPRRRPSVFPPSPEGGFHLPYQVRKGPQDAIYTLALCTPALNPPRGEAIPAAPDLTSPTYAFPGSTRAAPLRPELHGIRSSSRARAWEAREPPAAIPAIALPLSSNQETPPVQRLPVCNP